MPVRFFLPRKHPGQVWSGSGRILLSFPTRFSRQSIHSRDSRGKKGHWVCWRKQRQGAQGQLAQSLDIFAWCIFFFFFSWETAHPHQLLIVQAGSRIRKWETKMPPDCKKEKPRKWTRERKWERKPCLCDLACKESHPSCPQGPRALCTLAPHWLVLSLTSSPHRPPLLQPLCSWPSRLPRCISCSALVKGSPRGPGGDSPGAEAMFLQLLEASFSPGDSRLFSAGGREALWAVSQLPRSSQLSPLN